MAIKKELNKDKMKKLLLFIGMIISCNIMAQNVIDTSLFSIVYDFKVKTCDDQGVPVTDSIGVVTLVGTKCIDKRIN